MSQISPPIRILLVCAVAFMAAWMLFLRPKTESGAPAASTPATTATTPPVEAGGEKATSLAGQAVEKANEATAAQDARAEDKAVRKAVAGIDRHDNKVLAHATNIKRVASYQQITRGAEVEQSPTVVVVDRNRQVTSLVGYVDRQTIDQAVTDALRNSRGK